MTLLDQIEFINDSEIIDDDTIIKMMKKGRNIFIQSIKYCSTDDEIKKQYQELILNLNKLYKKSGLKIHGDGCVYSNKSINDFPRQPYTELNFFVEPEKYIKCIDVNMETNYKILFKVHCIEKQKCAYVIVNENNKSNWLTDLPKYFRTFSKEGTLDRISRFSFKLVKDQKISKKDALEYYSGTGWCFCNGDWIFNSLKDFKKSEGESALTYAELLIILNKNNDLLVKSLISFFILGINFEFLNKAKIRPEFILNIYGSSKVTKIEKIAGYFILPYNTNSKLLYNVDNPKIKKRSACLYSNKDKIIVANTNYIMDENPSEVNKRIRSIQDEIISELYYATKDYCNYSINSLVTIISQKKIYERKCFSLNGDNLDDSIYYQAKKINIYLGYIYKEYLQYMKQELKSNEYTTGLKKKYKEINDSLDEVGDDMFDDDIHKITFILLGYFLFVDYLSKKSIISEDQQNGMYTRYKELLISDFIDKNYNAGNRENRRQTERFIKQIYDIYLNNREMFIERTVTTKSDNYIGFFSKIRGESRLVFRKKDVIERFNDISNSPFRLSLTPDEMYKELKDIGVLFNYDTDRGFTYLKLQKERQETEVIQIVLEKLENHLKNIQ